MMINATPEMEQQLIDSIAPAKEGAKAKAGSRQAKSYDGRTADDGVRPDDCLELKARFHELEAMKDAVAQMEADFEASKASGDGGQKAKTGYFMKPYQKKIDSCKSGIEAWMAKKTNEATVNAEMAKKKAELMEGLKATEQAKKTAAKMEREQEAAAKRALKRDREAARDAQKAEQGDAAEAIAELTAEAKAKLWNAAENAIADMPGVDDENREDRIMALYQKLMGRAGARLQGEDDEE